MDFFKTLGVNASGLTAQRLRMNVISANLANVHSTRTENGGPYRRKIALLGPTPVKEFGDRLDRESALLRGVEVKKIAEDAAPFREVFNPGHPDANEKGYVAFPNVSVISEMADMMIAKRSYEANVAAMTTTKQMALKALEIGK